VFIATPNQGVDTLSFVIVRFLVFFGALAPLYSFVRSNSLQNLLILVGSYIFYAVWDWRFLSRLDSVSVANYVAPRAASNSLC